MSSEPTPTTPTPPATASPTPPPSADGTISITWPALPGNTYRIEYTDDLARAWQTHGQPITATADTMTITLPTGESLHRFFRVAFDLE